MHKHNDERYMLAERNGRRITQGEATELPILRIDHQSEISHERELKGAILPIYIGAQKGFRGNAIPARIRRANKHIGNGGPVQIRSQMGDRGQFSWAARTQTPKNWKTGLPLSIDHIIARFIPDAAGNAALPALEPARRISSRL